MVSNENAIPMTSLHAIARTFGHDVQPVATINSDERERHSCTRCGRTISLATDWTIYGLAFDENCD